MSVLDLRGNQIKSIYTVPGLDFEIHLENNPINCSCEFIFSNAHSIGNKLSGNCTDPAHLKGMQFTFAMARDICDCSTPESSVKDDLNLNACTASSVAPRVEKEAMMKSSYPTPTQPSQGESVNKYKYYFVIIVPTLFFAIFFITAM